MGQKILRMGTQQYRSILLEINAYLPRWVGKPKTVSLPLQVDALLKVIIANRNSIQALACKLRTCLGRLFPQTFLHSFAIFRLALDQALVSFSAMLPFYRDSKLREGLYALGLVLRIAKVSRCYLPALVPAGTAKTKRLHFYHTLIDRFILELEREIHNTRQISRSFDRNTFNQLRKYPIVPPFLGWQTILADVNQRQPFLGIPSLLNILSISRGWRIGEKRSWRGLPCKKKDLPPWEVKYLQWLQGALYGNLTLADRCRINKEARSLYHTIRRNSGKLIPLKYPIHHYQSITPMGIPPEDFTDEVWGLPPGGEHHLVAAKAIFKMLKPSPQIFIKTFTNPNPAQPVVVREPLLPPSRKPIPCSPEERTYYQTIHGFDPEAGWDGQHRRYCYNEWFSLGADPQLSVVGVTIGARVEQVPGGPPTNRIVFRNRDGKEVDVYCTHTVLYAGPADDALRFADDSILQHAPVQAELDFLAKTGGPVQLPPWGHFAALKSYVAGIAEVGILAMLGIASGAERVGSIPITFGFNAAMQRQVLSALRSVAPKATDAVMGESFLRLLDEVSLDWLIPRIEELDRKFKIAHVLFSRPEYLEVVLARVPAPKLLVLLEYRSSIFDFASDFGMYEKGFKILLNALPVDGRQQVEELIKKINLHTNSCEESPLSSVNTSSVIANSHLAAAQNVINNALTKHVLAVKKVSKLTVGFYPIRMATALVFSKAAWGTSMHRPSASCAMIREYNQTPLTPPADPMNPQGKKEPVLVIRLTGLKIQVHDAFIQKEFPLHEIVGELPHYLDMNRPEGKIALDQVCACIKSFGGWLKDYKDRPLKGLGDHLTTPGLLSRPYSEIVGVPLTTEEIALGLGDSNLTGCVVDLGKNDANSNYNAFLNIVQGGAGLSVINTGAYEETNATHDQPAGHDVNQHEVPNVFSKVSVNIDSGTDIAPISPKLALKLQQSSQVIADIHPWFISKGRRSLWFKKIG